MEKEEIVWRCSKVSNAWMNKYLLRQKQFPSQIAVAVKKTYNNNKKFLRKHVYCSGCRIKDRKTSFYFDINKMDLLYQKDNITISVKYLEDHNIQEKFHNAGHSRSLLFDLSVNLPQGPSIMDTHRKDHR